jgi:molybdenum cofactor cytidylyltransferase
MISAILLAAGRSRRMGAFKPLLPFGQKTVIETCVRNLLDGGVGEIVVVVGHRDAEIRAQLKHLPVKFALNDLEESEMGVSIARGVECISEDAQSLLIALADQPAVDAAAISFLIAAWKRTGKRLIIPEYEGRGGHPVQIDLSLRAELLNLVAEKGLRALFKTHPSEVLRLAVASPYVARDMDQWDDYRALHREVFGIEPESGEK